MGRKMRDIFGQVWLWSGGDDSVSPTLCIHPFHRFFFYFFAVSTTGLVSLCTTSRCLATGAHPFYSPSSHPYLWQPIIRTNGALYDVLVNKPWTEVGVICAARTPRTRLSGCFVQSSSVKTLVL